MDIPPKTDSCWAAILNGEAAFAPRTLASKLLVAHLRQVARQGPAGLTEAVERLHEYFAAHPSELRGLAGVKASSAADHGKPVPDPGRSG
jgi:hypothetical protein